MLERSGRSSGWVVAVWVCFLLSTSGARAAVPFGDANEDGSVGMADLNTLVDWILGRVTPPAPGSAAFTNADVDGSGTIGMADLNLLVDFILGRISTL